MKRALQSGLSLVELLVALAIGSVLIAGAVFVYVQSRNSYAVNDTVARLQENARYAFSVIEPDLRMSSFWGLVNDPGLVEGRATQTEAPAAVATGSAHACGNNFAVDLYNNLQGANASYPLACVAFGTGVPATADFLTVRRASAVPTDLTILPLPADRIRVWSSRTTARLFSNGVVPGSMPPDGQVHNLVVNAYYVSLQSDNDAAVPSLRRQTLVAGPNFQDQEIVPGVEDLQVQFGVDPTGLSETATQYLNAGPALTNALNAGGQIVAVRVWILVRAERPEVGYTNNTPYNYADRNVPPPNDNFRRLLFSRTIQVRNSIG